MNCISKSIVSLKVPLWYLLVLIVESIKYLSPLPRGRTQISNLVKYCVGLLYCFSIPERVGYIFSCIYL